MPYCYDAECIECGHAVNTHTDNGCIHRSAGTRESPPRICLCDRTSFELRIGTDMGLAARTADSARKPIKNNGADGFDE